MIDLGAGTTIIINRTWAGRRRPPLVISVLHHPRGHSLDVYFSPPVSLLPSGSYANGPLITKQSHEIREYSLFLFALMIHFPPKNAQAEAVSAC